MEIKLGEYIFDRERHHGLILHFNSCIFALLCSLFPIFISKGDIVN